MKTLSILLFSLGLCAPSFAEKAPKGSFLSSKFEEAQAAAKAQGKALVFIETDSESTCPKTQWGTAEAYSALKRDYILVIFDRALPECVKVPQMYPAIIETSKLGNSSPRITVVEPVALKFITGADYRIISGNKRWDKEMDAKITAAMKPLVDEKSAAAAPKVEPIRDWTNTDGKTIRASLVAKNPKSISLKLENGKVIDYPVDKLSPESKAALSEN